MGARAEMHNGGEGVLSSLSGAVVVQSLGELSGVCH